MGGSGDDCGMRALLLQNVSKTQIGRGMAGGSSYEEQGRKVLDNNLLFCEPCHTYIVM